MNMRKCNDKWTGTDKRKHFAVCLLLSILCPPMAVIAAIGKEIYDALTPGNHFCLKDLVADLAGMVAGCTIHVMILWIILN